MADIFTLEPEPNAIQVQLEEGGKVYTLPLITALPVKEARKWSKALTDDDSAKRIEAMYGYVEKFAPDIYRDFTYGQLLATFQLWAKGTKDVSLGESQDSAD